MKQAIHVFRYFAVFMDKITQPVVNHPSLCYTLKGRLPSTAAFSSPAMRAITSIVFSIYYSTSSSFPLPASHERSVPDQTAIGAERSVQRPSGTMLSSCHSEARRAAKRRVGCPAASSALWAAPAGVGRPLSEREVCGMGMDGDRSDQKDEQGNTGRGALSRGPRAVAPRRPGGHRPESAPKQVQCRELDK